MARIRARLTGGLIVVALSFPAVALARADLPIPLAWLVIKMTAYLRLGEQGGVKLESRHLSNFPEQIRLTVVPQLLGFCELHRVWPSDWLRQDIVDRADFLAQNISWCRIFDASDGMLAYALLQAHEITGDIRYRQAAQPIVDWCIATPGIEQPLNRGLMAAMALAQHHRITGDPVALTRMRDIVTLVARSQHADGSFAHVCEPSRDVHYTTWMSMELDRIGQLVDEPNVDRILTRTYAFLQDRVDFEGEVSYEDTLPSGETIPYYSRPYCPNDYDTRGWVNELAYHALLFSRYQDPRFLGLMARLGRLETLGAVPDKWGYMPPVNDPLYAWANSQRSVMRTSLVFWALSATLAQRAGGSSESAPVTPWAGYMPSEADPPGRQSGSASLARPALDPAAPNPVRDQTWITVRLAGFGPVRLAVHDAAGRRVRLLASGNQGPGERRVRWDGRDEAGNRARAGIYFVRLEADGQVLGTRLALLD